MYIDNDDEMMMVDAGRKDAYSLFPSPCCIINGLATFTSLCGCVCVWFIIGLPFYKMTSLRIFVGVCRL